MGRSQNRQLHFDKNIRNQPTAEKYINALYASPYRMHKRMARLLHEKYKVMMKEQQDKLIEEMKDVKEEDLEDTIGVLPGGDKDNG